jgi:hypothetical protein
MVIAIYPYILASEGEHRLVNASMRHQRARVYLEIIYIWAWQGSRSGYKHTKEHGEIITAMVLLVAGLEHITCRFLTPFSLRGFNQNWTLKNSHWR